MLNRIIVLVLLLLGFNSLKSQSYLIFDPIKIDYLTYKYKYLDSSYKIHVSSDVFNEAMSKYKFYPERIRKYNDSLSVIMMLEFGDWDKCRIACLQVGYLWLRLAYHTWQTEEEAKKFAKSVGITHPWRMQQYLEDDTNNSPEVIDFFKKLKLKILLSNKNVNFSGLNRERILSLALKLNPVRIADVQKDAEIRQKEKEAYLKKHGILDPSKIGVGCEKENCCQKPIVQKKLTENDKNIY